MKQEIFLTSNILPVNKGSGGKYYYQLFSSRQLKVINTNSCGIYMSYSKESLSSLSRTILNLNLHKYLKVYILFLVNSNRHCPIKLKKIYKINL